MKIDDQQLAGLKITRCHERPRLLRALLGLFSGVDQIDGPLTWRAGNAQIRDRAGSTGIGIDNAARDVGVQVCKRIEAKPEPQPAKRQARA